MVVGEVRRLVASKISKLKCAVVDRPPSVWASNVVNANRLKRLQKLILLNGGAQRKKKCKYSPPPPDHHHADYKPYVIHRQQTAPTRISCANSRGLSTSSSVVIDAAESTKTHRIQHQHLQCRTSSSSSGGGGSGGGGAGGGGSVRTVVSTRYADSKMKLRERLVIGAVVFVVLFTLMLVIDLQLDLGMAGQRLAHSHGRIRYGDGGLDSPGSAYNSFRKRFLQRTNTSKESPATAQVVAKDFKAGAVKAGARSAAVADGSSTTASMTEEHDGFPDLLAYLMKTVADTSDVQVIGRTDHEMLKKFNQLTFETALKLESR